MNARECERYDRYTMQFARCDRGPVAVFISGGSRAGKGSDVQVGEAGDRVIQEGRRKCQANQSQGNGTSVGNMVENVR